jgi:hypothetical protein
LVLLHALATGLAAAVAATAAPVPVPVPDDATGIAPPGAMLPLPPFASPQAPPVPISGERPPPGPMPGPAPRRRLSRVLAEAPLPRNGPVRGISDGEALVLDGSQVLAAATIARARASGARIVRVPMSWRAVERLGAPTEPINPGDPAYDFAIWDDLVRRIVRAGLEPLITVYEAPDRAEASPRWRFAAPGTWAPDPAAFGRFAAAVATRYSGHYPDPLSPSHALPHVRWWQAWNEPNLPRFLQPQWVVRNGRWHTYAPQRYRAMLNAFWEAIKSVDPHDTVLTAGSAPIGEPRDGEGRMAPVRFWQAVLCLGSAPRVRVERCPDPAHFDLLAHHPLSIGDPTLGSVGPLDVAIADLDRVSRLLREAQRHGLVCPRAGQRLAVTELNWDSRPPDPRGVSGELAARYVAAAFFLLWRQGATLVLWQLMRDPVPAPGARLHPAGLYRVDRDHPLDPGHDRPKPMLRAFRMPFVAWRRDADSVDVWGLVRVRGVRHAAIQRRRGRHWRTLADVAIDPSGMASSVLRLRGRAVLRLADSMGTSAAWRIGTKPTSFPTPKSVG